jgi:hypothetical protein
MFLKMLLVLMFVLWVDLVLLVSVLLVLTTKELQWFGGEPLYFDGIRVAMVSGMPSNKMVAAQSSNLYFGTGLA